MIDSATAQEAEYRVSWTVDVSASSPEEAARKARAMQIKEDSIADVFEVASGDDVHRIDLSDLDGRCVD
jgi:hypothetical protein